MMGLEKTLLNEETPFQNAGGTNDGSWTRIMVSMDFLVDTDQLPQRML